MATPVRDAVYGPNYNPYNEFLIGLYPYSDFGWNSNDQQFKTYVERTRPSIIIEVGTYFGGSARHMVNICNELGLDTEVVCIDTWLGSVEHWERPEFREKLWCCHPTFYQQFMSNVIHKGMQKWITPLPCDSVNAAYLLQRKGIKADLVYIDAGHEYESVKIDLKLYKDLLRHDGCMLIDDGNYDPIRRAADEELPGNRLEGQKRVWIKS